MSATKAIPSPSFSYEQLKDFYTEQPLIAQTKQMQGVYVRDRTGYVEKDFDAGAKIGAVFSAENTIIQKLEKNVCQQLSRVWIKIRLTSTSAASVLEPTPFWFKRVEIWGDDNTKMQVIYPEDMLFRLNQIAKEEDRNAIKELCGFGSNGRSWNTGISMASGETRNFWFPLFAFIDQANINMQNVANHFEIRMVTRGDINQSATAAVPTVVSYSWIIQERVLGAESKRASEAISRNIARTYYLDVHRESHTTNPSLTSGSEYNVPLSAVPTCFSPFVLVTIRENSSQDPDSSGTALTQYIPLGPDGKIILRKNNNNVFESSGAADSELLYRIANQKLLHGDLLRKMPMYLLNFADSIDGPMNGSFLNGFYNFDGTNANTLRIQAYSGTSCVQTISSPATVAPDAGRFRLQFGKDITAALDYNETAANIKAALEGLDSFKEQNLTVTVTQPFSTAGTLVFTFPPRCGNVSELIQMHPDNCNDGGTACNPSSALTQKGVFGVNSGQVHTIDVYVYHYRFLNSLGGRFKSQIEYDR